MEGVFVGSLMSSPAHTVTSDVSLREAGRTLLGHDIGSIVVEGVITTHDLTAYVSTVRAPHPPRGG